MTSHSSDDLMRLAVCRDGQGIRWVCPGANTWSEEFGDVESAWVWRRRVGDAKLLPYEIPPGASWVDYAAIAHDPDTSCVHRLVRCIDAQQVRDAISDYTAQRLRDGESIRDRAVRLLGASHHLASSTSSQIAKDFGHIERRLTVWVAGREWMARGNALAIDLVEVSRGAPFSERRLRPVRRSAP